MKNSIIFVLGAGLLSTWIYSCKNTNVDVAAANSFDNIQSQIIDKNCATSGCHASEKDPTFQQHGLLLTKGISYENLFGKSPKNITAKEAGLKLVKAFDAENSLLYQKLLFETTHKSQQNFGSIMPLGGDLLLKGQIEYVRRWIEAGAPKTGSVVDVSLLSDPTPSLAKFVPLAAPAVGTGFQMKLEPFEIYSNFEREVFIRKPLGNKEPVYVSSFQLKMHPGSHHFIVYGFRDTNKLPELNIMRDLRNKDQSLNLKTFTEMSNHIFYFGGSESNFTFNFPEGMAVEIPAEAQFDLNSHYFNKGSKSYYGEVNINLNTIPKAKVSKILSILDLGNTTFSLPPKTRTEVKKDFTFNSNVKIVTLFSHTHKMGEKFEILIKGGTRNGEVVYTSTNWEHPNKIDFAIPISLKKGEGLTSRITYNNTSDQTLRFGFTSEDEMGIIFGYYYEE